jgi:hypothetical protein
MPRGSKVFHMGCNGEIRKKEVPKYFTWAAMEKSEKKNQEMK